MKNIFIETILKYLSFLVLCTLGYWYFSKGNTTGGIVFVVFACTERILIELREKKL